MATVEDFILRINVQGQGNIKSVSADVGNLRKDIDGLSQVGGPLGNTINGIIGKLGPLGVAASLAGLAFAALGGRALQAAGELADISGATGIAAGQLLSLKASIIDAGGRADDFGQIAAKLNQSVQEAAGGNEKLQEAFRTLGVFVTDAAGKIRPTGDILDDITAKAQRGEITQSQYAAAVDILGKNINKLELEKLRSLRDPVVDEDIKRLDAYNEALDRVRARLEKGIISFFGSVAEQANKAFDAVDAYEKKIGDAETRLNEMGKTSRAVSLPGRPLEQPLGATGLPDWMQRQMTAEEKAFYEQQRRYKEQEKLMSAYRTRAGAPSARDAAQGQGGYGQTPEAVKKAVEESEKRIAQSKIEVARAGQLQQNEQQLALTIQNASKMEQLASQNAASIKAIEINLEQDKAKAKLDIYSQEKLSEQQKATELAQKEIELTAKSEEAKAKLRSQYLNQMEAERRRIEDIIAASNQYSKEIAGQVELERERNRVLNDTATKSDREQQNAQAILRLEEDRLTAIRRLAQTKDLPAQERLRLEQEINGAFNERKKLITDQQAAEVALTQDFTRGWEKAYNDYVEMSKNSFQQANNYFNLFTRGFEDAFVKFVETGKLSFKDLANTMIAELARVQARNLLNRLMGAGSGSGGLLGGTIIPGFLAEGGPANANKPYIVGEQGPELFIPRSTGTVIPNSALTNNGIAAGASTSVVTYNINAVDAPSFKALVARDPSFIHAVAMQGASGIPSRR